MIKIEVSVLFPEYQINTYLLWDSVSDEAMLIDPGAPSREFLNHIIQSKLKVKYVVNTHGHLDHIGGNDFFCNALNANLAIHIDDAQMLTNNSLNLSSLVGNPLKLNPATMLLSDGDILPLGDCMVKVIHTPGHTRGSICLLAGNYLVSGDTLFEQSIGRTDLVGGSSSAIKKSIKEKLFTLDENVLVFPGHGPATSIGLEKVNNPFIR